MLPLNLPPAPLPSDCYAKFWWVKRPNVQSYIQGIGLSKCMTLRILENLGLVDEATLTALKAGYGQAKIEMPVSVQMYHTLNGDIAVEVRHNPLGDRKLFKSPGHMANIYYPVRDRNKLELLSKVRQKTHTLYLYPDEKAFILLFQKPPEKWRRYGWVGKKEKWVQF